MVRDAAEICNSNYLNIHEIYSVNDYRKKRLKDLKRMRKQIYRRDFIFKN